MEERKSLVEGVFELREWHTAEGKLTPPAVDGRFVLRDGVVMTVLKNRAKAESRVWISSYGTYRVDGPGFTYEYDDGIIVTETPEGNRLVHGPLFGEPRWFSPTPDGSGIRLRRKEGEIEFAFTKDGLRYSEGGKLLRVWKRAPRG
jgi:hypothetical protein